MSSQVSPPLVSPRLRAEGKGPPFIILKHQGGFPACPWGWGTVLLAKAEQDQFLENCWSWWDTTTPVPHRHSQMCGILGSPYSEDAWGGWKALSRQSLRQPHSSFPPPHSRAQLSTVTKALYSTSLIPFWVCPHAHCYVRLYTTGSSTHTEKK